MREENPSMRDRRQSGRWAEAASQPASQDHGDVSMDDNTPTRGP
jgi:hypothetical protein